MLAGRGDPGLATQEGRWDGGGEGGREEGLLGRHHSQDSWSRPLKDRQCDKQLQPVT